MVATLNDGIQTTVSGTLSGGEIFNFGFWMSNVVVASVSDLQDVADQLEASASTTIFKSESDLLQGCSNHVDFKAITCRFYSAGTTAFKYEAQKALTAVGASSLHNMDQVCLVASLRTDEIGRKARGRMYLPCTALSQDAGGLITTALAQGIADNVAAWWNDYFTNQPTEGGTPAVLSGVDGVARTVTRVEVDNVPDTQRRRLNKIVGTYFSATVNS